ncbi:type II secretion system F family protein [Burkholderiaceae bacterium DAT-1]|nr:type II secretion system F family protein [Burkholderiaceae bacterium DAT-1]
MKFRYQAMTASADLVKGELNANSSADVFKFLEQQHLTPLEISKAVVKQSVWKRLQAGRVPKVSERITALKQLATLLSAGVSMLESIESLCEANEGTAFQDFFLRIRDALRAGEPLSLALPKGKLPFPEYVNNLIRAGEMTGTVSEALSSAVANMERTERLRQETISALIYPSILVTFGFGATFFIFTYVVPKFSGLLKSAKGGLPAISVWVLQAGAFTKAHQPELLLGLAALLGLTGALLALKQVRAALFNQMATLPLLGAWIHEAQIANWSGMMSLLLGNRVSIVQALELAVGAVTLPSMKSKFELVTKDIRAGKKVAESLKMHNAIDAIGVNLIAVGEKSGRLPSVLGSLSEMYLEKVRERMKRMVSLIEPIAILLVGGAIGLVLVAVMMAITSMSDFV